MRACQGFYGVFGTLALAGAVGIGVSATPAVGTPVTTALFVDVETWARRPFAEVVLDTPELAACHYLAPGSWSAVRPPTSPIDAARLGAAVRDGLLDVLGPSAPTRFKVVVAESEDSALAAVASGSTALLIVPTTKPWTADDGARAVITALARAHTSPAPPDPRCSEPLLSLAETLAVAGSLTIATLPPELRPVSDWLEAKDAVSPLATYAEAALDRDAPWNSRRVRLQGPALTNRANAQLLNAAALVAEAYGDLRRARSEPYDLLLAWRENRGERFPPMPPVLRRAIGAPLLAGMPSAKRADDEAVIAAQALQRKVETASLPAGARLDDAALPLRALAAANARATGSPAACAWLLAGPVPSAVRTGCRSDESSSGHVTSRPRPQGGFEIVAAAGNDEIVLLRWPRWALFPLVVAGTGQFLFADGDGIWGVALDGAAPPRMLAAGEYRHLALGPDGATIAAARWPAGTLVVVSATAGVRELGANARGGLAWLDRELIVVGGDDGAVVVSVRGERRPFGVELPCPHALARSGATLLVGAAAPCPPGIHAVALGGAASEAALKRSDGPAGIVAAPDGAVLFADPEGVFRWRPGEAPIRVGGGLTAGPS